jgi:long-chain acyl-CoA synthetase
MSSHSRTAPAGVQPPFVAIPDSIRAIAAGTPSKVAVICGELSVTWSAFDEAIDRCARYLLTLGLEKGDKVALLGGNTIEYLTSLLGVLRAGGVMVPLSTMAPPEALARMIDDADAKAFFVSRAYLPSVADVRANCPKLVDGGRIGLDFAQVGWISLQQALASVSSEPVHVAIHPEDDFNIIYSSGTTGLPKGILHSHKMRSALPLRFAAFGFSDSSISLVATPMYGNFTLAGMLPTLVFGGTVILMRKFDAAEWLRLAEQHRVTHAMLVPLMFQRLLAQPGFGQTDLSSFVTKFMAGSPASVGLKQEILDRFPGRLVELYGLTEGGPGSLLDATSFPHKLHTVGRPGLSVTLKIVDDEGRELPPGQVGEVVGSSDLMMMKGYYKQPDKTAELVWKDASGQVHYRSGDFGKLDDDGFLVLLDRKKDMIISGGFNVYAADIEAVVIQHPEVSEVAVIGVPSETWGETPLAIVVRKADACSSPSEICEWCNERLAKSARVSAVEIRDALPRSPLGKVMKRELRLEYWPSRSPAAGSELQAAA